MKHNFTAFVTFSSFFFLNFSKIYCGDILPDKGYWNYLPQLGTAGRLIHYFVADTDAFGEEITNLNKYFGNKYTPQEYANLERQVVLTLPVDEMEIRIRELLPSLIFVQDPKSGKTLGDAIFTLIKLLNDPQVGEEIADRLDLKDPKMLALEIPYKPQIDLQTILKDAIMHKPEAIMDTLQDPEVASFISGSIMDYLTSDEVKDGIHTFQGIVGMLEITYSSVLDSGENPMFAIKDRASGMTLGQTLKALANIIETPEFGRALKDLLNRELIDNLHIKTQEMVAKVTKNHPSTISADKLAELLIKNYDVKLDPKNVSNILELSRTGQLVRKAKRFLEKVDHIPNLNMENLTLFLKGYGVEFSPEFIQQTLEIVSISTPEYVSSMLKDLGLDVTPRQAETLIHLIKDIKSKLETESEDELSEETEKVDASVGESSARGDKNEEQYVASNDEELGTLSQEQSTLGDEVLESPKDEQFNDIPNPAEPETPNHEKLDTSTNAPAGTINNEVDDTQNKI